MHERTRVGVSEDRHCSRNRHNLVSHDFLRYTSFGTPFTIAFGTYGAFRTPILHQLTSKATAEPLPLTSFLGPRKAET